MAGKEAGRRRALPRKTDQPCAKQRVLYANPAECARKKKGDVFTPPLGLPLIQESHL
jgi:hypothetical protein